MTYKPGNYLDGLGLYLQVTNGAEDVTNRSWLFRFTSPETHKERSMGLGPMDKVSIGEARAARDAAATLVRQGIDPIAEKGRARARQAERAQRETAQSMSFDNCAAAYIKAHRAAWEPAHKKQWERTLAAYASLVLGSLPVAAIDTGSVLKALERDNFWNTKTETADRVRARIEKVLDWAEARGLRPEGVNPASRRKLANLLPSRRKLKPVKHFAAMPYQDVPAFVATLENIETMSARALEFTILTAARAGEACGARWGEIDWPAKIWTVPAGRMKMRRPHRIPLSEPAIQILGKLQEASVSEFVFPGTAGSILTNAMFILLRRRMGKKFHSPRFQVQLPRLGR